MCGALYDGVGIPACIASARRAAGEVLEALAGRDAERTRQRNATGGAGE